MNIVQKQTNIHELIIFFIYLILAIFVEKPRFEKKYFRVSIFPELQKCFFKGTLIILINMKNLTIILNLVAWKVKNMLSYIVDKTLLRSEKQLFIYTCGRAFIMIKMITSLQLSN